MKEYAVDDECSAPLSYRISKISDMLKQEQFAEEAAIAELAKSRVVQWWEHSAADPTNIYVYGVNGKQVPNTPSGAAAAHKVSLFAICISLCSLLIAIGYVSCHEVAVFQ